MNPEDLTEIERAGRRCAVCHSARGWHRFEVVRVGERAPVVLCASCRVRFGNDPPVGRELAPESPRDATAKTASQPEPPVAKRRIEQRPDRLRAALANLPGSFSTAVAARAAGLSDTKTLSRLQDLESRGEVRRDGNRWTTAAPPTDLTAAIDRLEARTSNLRIIRERAPVA